MNEIDDPRRRRAAREADFLAAVAGAEGLRARLHPEAAARPRELASAIDHTLLRPEATRSDIERLCDEARRYGFAAVCVNPVWIGTCVARLRGTAVRVATVAGFPLGASDPEVVALEASRAVEVGADEIDMVLPVGALRGGDERTVLRSVGGVRRVTLGLACLKVILETHLLTEAETVRACELAVAAGCDFVKTATGFTGGGATVAAVRLLRAIVGPAIGVKAAGGIRERAIAEALLAAGANRLGTSAGVAIVTS